MNIAIMRAFVHFRKMLEVNLIIRKKIDDLENTVTSHDKKIKIIFQVIEQLIGEKDDDPPPPRKRIGFKIGED